MSYVRKTSTQPWQIRLVFSRDHEEMIELPATMNTRSVWQHIRQTYYPRCPAIHVLARGRRQQKA